MAQAASRFFEERHVNPDAVSVPAGFRMEVAARGLNNPACIEFDEEGNIFVGEMGSPSGSAYRPGRILRVRPDGTAEAVVEDLSGSITGLAYREGAFYAVEHGETSRVYRIHEDGTREVLVDDLPGGGDHPTSEIVFGHSGRMYFGQGARTNSGVVGPDNEPWLRNHPELSDIPAKEVILAGRNFESRNLFGPGTVETGAFKPYGISSREGELLGGLLRSTGTVMRADTDGADLEMFAWGIGNPFGLGVHPDGRIFCTDGGMKPVGSRPVADDCEYLWHLVEGNWYGWPDYSGGDPVTDPKFKPQDGPQPGFLLKYHPPLGGKPAARLPGRPGIAKFDFSRSPLFGSDDVAFVALMGDLSSPGASETAGFKVIAVDVGTGAVEDFIANKHPGPASSERSGGLERPVAAKFDRTGEAMYVLDLGIVQLGTDSTLPNTGVIWRIVPSALL